MPSQLVTIHPFDPCGSKIGGIETAVRSMLQHAPDDFELSLVGVTENPDERPVGIWQDLEFQGKTVHFFPVFAVEQPNQRTVVPLFLRFPLKVRACDFHFENAIAVYHRIEPLAFTNLPAHRNVLCIHGDPREIIGPQSEVRWRHIPWLYRMMESRAVRKSQRLFVVSKSGVDYFKESYPEKQNAVSFLSTYYRDEIFLPADLEETQRIRKRWMNRLGLQEPKKLVLFAGRWEEQKNPLLALQAFALLAVRYPTAYLLLAGSGSLKPRMESLMDELQISHRVKILGPLIPSALAEALHASDAFLLTSQFEGMPIAVLEALACGTPIVSTPVGEMKSLVIENQTGRIVTQSNPISLADALFDVFNQPESYRRDVCSRSVETYRPQAILPPFFDAIRSLI